MRDDTVEKVRFGSVFAAADRILRAARLEPLRPEGAQAELSKQRCCVTIALDDRKVIAAYPLRS